MRNISAYELAKGAWMHQGKTNEAAYGVTFKIIKVLVKLPLGRSLRNQEEEQMVDFLDSDSD